MRTLEELQQRIDKNIDEQNRELEEYKNIIFQLIINNQFEVSPNDDDTFYKRLSFNFNMKNDAIVFECAIVENNERDKDVDATISQLYIKDGSKEVNKLIDYLCDVIIPSFKRDPYKSIQKKWDYM